MINNFSLAFLLLKFKLVFLAEKLFKLDAEKVVNVKDFIARGDVLYFYKYYGPSIIYYEKAHKANQYNAEALLKLAASLERINDFQEAIKYADELLQIESDNYNALLIKGLAYENSGDVVNAEKAYLEALKINPEFFEANHNIGILYDNSGKVNEAIMYYVKALNINSDDEYSIHRLSYLYNKKGEYEKFIEIQKSLIKKYPKSSKLYGNIAVGYAENMEYEKAIESFNKAIELAPNDFGAYYNKAVILFDLNKMDECIAVLKKAISISKNSAEAYFLYGKAYFYKKQYKEAIPLFQKAFKINGVDYDVLVKVADCYINMDNPEQAAKVLDFILKKDSNNELANIKKGIILSNYGRYDEASQNFKKVQVNHSESTTGFYYMGVMYMNREFYKQAVKEFSEALKRGKNGLIFSMRAKCYVMLKELEKAKSDLIECFYTEPSTFGEVLNDDVFVDIREEIRNYISTNRKII